MWIKIFGMIFMFLQLSCTKKELSSDPKGRLKEYIEKSFHIRRVSDKKILAGYLTGQAKRRLESWSDDQFAAAFIDRKRENPKFKLKDFKKQSADEVNITYELSFTSLDQNEAKVINRKSCQLVNLDDAWYIKKCRNIKQVVEYREAIEVLPFEGT